MGKAVADAARPSRAPTENLIMNEDLGAPNEGMKTEAVHFLKLMPE